MLLLKTVGKLKKNNASYHFYLICLLIKPKSRLYQQSFSARWLLYESLSEYPVIRIFVFASKNVNILCFWMVLVQETKCAFCVSTSECTAEVVYFSCYFLMGRNAWMPKIVRFYYVSAVFATEYSAIELQFFGSMIVSCPC